MDRPNRSPSRLPSSPPASESPKVTMPIRTAASENRGRWIREPEADPDRERVDARGDGEQQQHPDGEGRADLVLPPEESLVEHPAADRGEEQERDPVVDSPDQPGEGRPEEPARHRHQGLEEPEGEGHRERAADPLGAAGVPTRARSRRRRRPSRARPRSAAPRGGPWTVLLAAEPLRDPIAVLAEEPRSRPR